MSILDNILTGLDYVFALESIAALALGVVAGVIFGVMPGLTATMGVALLAPLTFAFDPLTAIPFLIGVYRGGINGGAITGILIGVPGTPANVPILFDGHKLAEKGYPNTALKSALYSSVFGALVAALLLVSVIEQVATVALNIGSPELFALLAVAMTLVAFISGDKLSKGILAAALGMFVGLIGLDPVTGTARFTFGFPPLLGGVSMIPMFIGLFAVSEMVNVVERHFRQRRVSEDSDEDLDVGNDGSGKYEDGKGSLEQKADDNVSFFGVLRRNWRAILVGAGTGSVVGALPGVGTETSAWISYGLAKRVSRRKSEYGTGGTEGIVAPEAANDAVASAAFVPTLVFGIPGDMPLAVMMGAFVAQGFRPGPRLFEQEPEIMFGVVMAVLLSSFVLLLVVRPMTPLLSKAIRIPPWALVPIVGALCIAGSYAVNNDPFDLYVLAIFGIFGVVMQRSNTPFAPFVLAFIVGPIMERNFRESLMLGGSADIFLRSPVSVVLLGFALLICLTAVAAAVRNAIRSGSVKGIGSKYKS